MSSTKLNRTPEAAAKLNISPSTLDTWACRGGGPKYVKVGRLRMYTDEALEEFITQRTRTSTSQLAAAV